jgi:hypothetical protein
MLQLTLEGGIRCCWSCFLTTGCMGHCLVDGCSQLAPLSSEEIWQLMLPVGNRRLWLLWLSQKRIDFQRSDNLTTKQREERLKQRKLTRQKHKRVFRIYLLAILSIKRATKNSPWFQPLEVAGLQCEPNEVDGEILLFASIVTLLSTNQRVAINGHSVYPVSRSKATIMLMDSMSTNGLGTNANLCPKTIGRRNYYPVLYRNYGTTVATI